jgi:hypothetical protein
VLSKEQNKTKQKKRERDNKEEFSNPPLGEVVKGRQCEDIAGGLQARKSHCWKPALQDLDMELLAFTALRIYISVV